MVIGYLKAISFYLKKIILFSPVVLFFRWQQVCEIFYFWQLPFINWVNKNFSWIFYCKRMWIETFIKYSFRCSYLSKNYRKGSHRQYCHPLHCHRYTRSPHRHSPFLLSDAPSIYHHWCWWNYLLAMMCVHRKWYFHPCHLVYRFYFRFCSCLHCYKFLSIHQCDYHL